MKKHLFTALTLLACSGSCTKNGVSPYDPSNYYIMATVDGNRMLFNSLMSADTTRYGTISITGFADTTTYSPYIHITLRGNPPLKKGDYPCLSAPDFNSGILGYANWPGQILQDYTSYDDTVSVTDINTITVSGTFRGTVNYYAPNYSNGTYFLDSTKAITNGVFYLPLGRN
ncbi:MAG: hypothetical protein P4L51_03775 [Puia sp.]|nr:hypothetical protein [Puia sp.]